MKTSRELVYETLEFRNPERAPRDLWILPWAEIHYSEELNEIQEQYPGDIIRAPGFCRDIPVTKGDPHKIGQHVDEWGCIFENRADGIIGEVKEGIVSSDDEEWKDTSRIHIPVEWLTIDKEEINKFCRETDQFVLAGACPRPFEQLQFIRGTEQLYMDLMFIPEGLNSFMKEMHVFYCRLLTAWAETDVDALMIMDDWGAQQSLLINPELWVQIFKPLYKDYIDIAHAHGKKIFMHSDGNILQIIPHLIDLGLDAVNSQLFCMGIDKLEKYSGKITFWGEMDRQHLLPVGSVEDIEEAVASVRSSLWRKGGCIAQCEFGPGAKPENVSAVYSAWNRIL